MVRAYLLLRRFKFLVLLDEALLVLGLGDLEHGDAVNAVCHCAAGRGPLCRLLAGEGYVQGGSRAGDGGCSREDEVISG